jgi:hypothetical protein
VGNGAWRGWAIGAVKDAYVERKVVKEERKKRKNYPLTCGSYS